MEEGQRGSVVCVFIAWLASSSPSSSPLREIAPTRHGDAWSRVVESVLVVVVLHLVMVVVVVVMMLVLVVVCQ